MKNPVDVVDFYLQRINSVSQPVEKQLIKDDLLLYYYRLTETECETVRSTMQPILDEKRREMETKDPLLKRAGNLLRHLEANQTVISQ